MNGRLFMEAMGDIKDDFIMEASDIDEIRKCFSEWDDEEEDAVTEPEKTEHKKIKRIPRIRKFLIAAVISALLLLATNFVAMALGYDTLAILKEFGDRIIEMFEGERTEYKGTTITKGGEVIAYSSVERFYCKTEYNVLYPSKLPRNIKIESVELFGSSDCENNYTSNYKTVFFITNKSPCYNVEINMNPDADKFFLTEESFSTVNINNLQCFYIQSEDVQCYFIHNNHVYYLSAPTYDDIVTIVSNMKEYEE